MSRPGIIGDELGLARWKAMWVTRMEQDGLLFVNLQAKRLNLDFDSQRNMKWNMRTILLLVRAGVITVECPPNVECLPQGKSESLEAYQMRRREFWQSESLKIYFKLIGNNPNNEEAWELSVGEYRRAFQTTSARSWSHMTDLLGGERELVDILQEVYCVPEANVNFVPDKAENIEPVVSSGIEHEVSSQLKGVLDNVNNGCLFVTYPVNKSEKSQLGRLWVEFLKILARHGICEFSLPCDWRDREKWFGRPNPLGDLHRSSVRRFVVVRDIKEDEQFSQKMPLPRVSFITPDFDNLEIIIGDLRALNRPHHIIMLPEGCQDPHNPQRTIEETYKNVITINNLLNNLNR